MHCYSKRIYMIINCYKAREIFKLILDTRIIPSQKKFIYKKRFESFFIISDTIKNDEFYLKTSFNRKFKQRPTLRSKRKLKYREKNNKISYKMPLS